MCNGVAKNINTQMVQVKIVGTVLTLLVLYCKILTLLCYIPSLNFTELNDQGYDSK